MGVLQWHAKPAFFNGNRMADHTSVSCAMNPGRLWVCQGTPPSGPVMAAAPGSTAMADCISTPAAVLGIRDLGGILYGVTGVCHQVANRILFPSGLIVNAARGYRLSSAAFGRFGLNLGFVRARLALQGKFVALIRLKAAVKLFGAVDWVVKLNACVNVGGDIPPCAPAAGVPLPPPPHTSAEEEQYLTMITELYEEAFKTSDSDADSDEAFLTLTFGMPADEAEERRFMITEARTKLLAANADSLAEFLENEIDTQHWVERVNGNFAGFQSSILEILGPEFYMQNLQIEPGEVMALIDPEIAAAAYGDEFSVT